MPKQTSEEKEDELNKTQSDEEMAQACEHVEQEVRNVQTVHFTEQLCGQINKENSNSEPFGATHTLVYKSR